MGHEKCITVPEYEMGTCTTVLKELESYPCQKPDHALECRTVDTPREGTCFRDETQSVPYTCYDVDFEEQCIDLPITGAPLPPPAPKEMILWITVFCLKDSIFLKKPRD